MFNQCVILCAHTHLFNNVVLKNYGSHLTKVHKENSVHVCILLQAKTRIFIANLYLFARDDNVSIYKNVSEKKKLAHFWLLAAYLGQHALANDESTRNCQRLPQIIRISIGC